jgi:membrane-associated phospholipid phosphatase
MTVSPTGSPRSWVSECMARLGYLWFFKSTGTALFMVIFFYSYFALLRSPVFPTFTMPTTWVDDWVVFWPPAFYLYASLWLYTSLVPALQPSLLRLVAFGCAMGSLCLTALVLFLFFPTAVPFTASADWFKDPSISLLRQIDLAGNACPSLHVASAVFSAACLHKLLGEMACPAWLKISNAVWCLLIVYSTMAIKQHVMWDVVAGALLALIFSLLYPQLEKRLVET